MTLPSFPENIYSLLNPEKGANILVIALFSAYRDVGEFFSEERRFYAV